MHASAKRKDSELEAKSRALEEKDATISAMSEQPTKARRYLTTKKQVSLVHRTLHYSIVYYMMVVHKLIYK